MPDERITVTDMTILNVDEYLLLALDASEAGERHACMRYLQAVLQLEPRNGRAVYLLAVQHAELGLVDRSISGLKMALALDASLETARLQLGLMLLDCERSVEARPCFEALAASEDLALRMCSAALLSVASGDSTAAQHQLRLGLELESGNPPLLSLMRRLLQMLVSG